MNSRLDRLFLLLDQGSSSLTRRAAAQQLGEVQKLHPHELNNLLSKVRGYLQSTCWETRIAASLAIEAIIKQIPEWLPDGTVSETEWKEANNLEVKIGESLGGKGRMRLNLFQINRVIECGKDLLASEGLEYEVNMLNNDNLKSDSLKEKLSMQRQLLNKKLGLDVAQKLNLGIKSDDLISNEDLQSNLVDKSNTESKKVQVKELLSSLPCSDRKRKATQSNGSPICEKRIKSEETSIFREEESYSDETKIIDLYNLKEWPLQSFCDQLMGDLFSPLWEIRHGAATALREIIKLHGKCAGRVLDAPTSQMDSLNQLWLEDLALRLICVLALDKFGDYISDQVVAPVRETCAQALGSVFHIMSRDNVFCAVNILLELLLRPEWETRHGGLLALKYLLAIRTDLTCELLPLVFDTIFNGLKDSEDDVSAVAAAALVPVRDTLIEKLPDKVPAVIDFLWDALLEIDELTSSTCDILKLLSSLLIKYQNHDPIVLRKLVPRLWPFLGHTLSSVRKSVIESLLVLTSNDVAWLDITTLADSLRLLYQRCLTESNPEISNLLFTCWSQFISQGSISDLIFASSPYLSCWICLMMHPAKNPIDASFYNVWLVPKRHTSQSSNNSTDRSKDHIHHREIEKQYLGGDECLHEAASERGKNIVFARSQAAKFIGLIAEYLSRFETVQVPTPFESFIKLLLFHINSKSAIQRTCVAWILKEWSNIRAELNTVNGLNLQELPQSLVEKCLDCLTETVNYDELAASYNRLLQDTQDYIATLKHHKIISEDNQFSSKNSMTIDKITELIALNLKTALESSRAKNKSKLLENLEERKRLLQVTCEEYSRYQSNLSLMVLNALSSSLVAWKILPEKFNPIVRPLMDSIKRESNEILQKSAAHHLGLLLELCITNNRTETSSPVTKIINNLVAYLCTDINFTPNLVSPAGIQVITKGLQTGSTSGSCSPSTPVTPDFSNGIISLNTMYKQNERANLKRLNSSNSLKKSIDSVDECNIDSFSEDMEKQNELIRRGATFSLAKIVSHFGKELPEKLPQLWDYINKIEMLSNHVFQVEEKNDLVKAQELINSLQVLEIISPHLDKELHSHLINILPTLCKCLENIFSPVRHIAARCFGVLSTIITSQVMNLVLSSVLDLLGSSCNESRRQGAIEAVHCIVEKLGFSIIPYIVLLIIPMLGRMSDQNDQVRLLATHCFAQLVQLMPLDSNKSDPSLQINSELLAKKQHERHFLEQLMNPKKLDDFKLPIPVKAELRSYQQEGINWLFFLNRYKLHGILCDEMGLGKTLMSICILASDHFLRSEKYQSKKAPDSKPIPSLVVCPPTLTGHWMYEVEKFVDKKYLNPLHYTGPPMERTKLRTKVKNHKKAYNLVIASYDIVRNDIDFFSSLSWNYCILDEGHIIKNGKTKLSKAIKSLSANHRLILTGTPIQNNVLELWSLFDFLIPGFLGTEKQFLTRYSKPILQSRDAKSSSKEQESGVLAMESLHRQSLPFILRRMKDDVLKDLPPKIIQDYYCELSELQSQLYEDFAKSRVRESLECSVNSWDSKPEANTDMNFSHVFQALQYLRKVCNHPKLILTSQHPQYESVLNRLREQNSSLNDINHAAKLCALKQLLLDCGIGTQVSSIIGGTEPVVNQHRVLIFCQLKGMLDIVENDLLKTHMPSVSYLRLDGSIPAGSRHSLVYRFNNDPSIDVLLLTTQVGGLGLNLTGADTVIFVEHDWNPMKDLQAMDRAHRIGQKKVVNVYRLITKGTLEEKIMGLQKFKLTIANSVISTENSGLQTMGTDQLLDLFCLDNNKELDNRKEISSLSKESKRSGMKSVLENLPELWTPDQYENEYDLTNFIESLKS